MTEPLPIVDANVFPRHIRQDHANHSLRSSSYLVAIRRGQISAQTNELVLSEVFYVLQSFYKMSNAEIAAAVTPIIALPYLRIPNKRRLRTALQWCVRYNISFVDAYLAAVVQDRRLPAVVSFDRGYDRIPGITRSEP